MSTKKSDDQLELLKKISGQIDKQDDKLTKLEGSVSSMDKKMDLHIQKSEFEFDAIKSTNVRSDRLEQDNILREQGMRKDMGTQSDRIDSLEKPREWFKMTRKAIIWIGGIAAALFVILRLLDMF